MWFHAGFASSHPADNRTRDNGEQQRWPETDDVVSCRVTVIIRFEWFLNGDSNLTSCSCPWIDWYAVSELRLLMKARCFFAAAQTCSPKWRATVQGWSMTLHKILFMALVAQELVTSKPHTLVLLYVLTWRSNHFLYLNKLNAGLYFSLAHITLCTWHIWTRIK